jgi:hypothetical protein
MMGASDPRDDDTLRENPSDGEQRREAASGQTSTAATAVAEEETKPRRTCWRKRFHVVPPKRRWQRRHTHDRHMDTEQVKDEPPPVVSVSLNVHNHNTQGPTETMDFMQKLGAGIALGYLVYRMLTAVGWLKLGPIEDEDSPGLAAFEPGVEPEEEEAESWDPARWGDFLALADTVKTVMAAMMLAGSWVSARVSRPKTGI